MADCIDHNVYKFVLKENIEVFFQNQFQDIYTRLKDSFIQINYNSNITLLDVNEVIYVKYSKTISLLFFLRIHLLIYNIYC